MLQSLIRKGLIEENPSARDSRVKYLHLTQQGHVRHRVISQSAEQQIIDALAPLSPVKHQEIVLGLVEYADALTSSRGLRISGTGTETVIQEGYAPGVIGRITELHGAYYSRLVGFGASFESKVASGLAEFIPRVNRSGNLLLRAESGGRIVGSIAIDGEDLGNGLAHLRWFIVDDAMRRTGLGRALIGKAMEFCDRQNFKATQLWTFKGLDAARQLYEIHGFQLVDEFTGDQWGVEVLEQKFERAGTN